MAVGAAKFQQGFDAAIDLASRRVDLLEVAQPFAAFADRLVIAAGQRQQGFQLAHAQVGPE